MNKVVILIIGLLWASLLLISWSGPAESTSSAQPFATSQPLR